MKCLFVRHPFAGWIVDGVKTIEYRSMQTKIRGRIGIVQSKSGTVIGDVEITGCEWNDQLQSYEWALSNARRYKAPLPFKGKSGAVVWIEVDYNPDEQEKAPKLTAAAMKREKAAYEAEIASFLNPAEPEEEIECFWAVMKDGSEIRFEVENEKEFRRFIREHRKEVARAEVEVKVPDQPEKP